MYLVTGVGRSGTSFVAEVLHNNGICMGHNFPEPDEHNPNGYWECADSFKALDNFENPKGVHKAAGCASKLIGVKQPKICEFPIEHLKQLKPELIIICLRQEEQILESIRNFNPEKTEEQMINFVTRRMYCLESILGSDLPCVTMDFSVRRSVGYVLELAGLQ